MSVKKLCISLPNWIISEILSDSKNRSGRIEELILKGYMAEKEKNKNALNWILSRLSYSLYKFRNFRIKAYIAPIFSS